MRPWFAPLAGLALCACGIEHRTHDPFGPTLKVLEQEPNNQAFSANGIGPIGSGAQIEIYGQVAGQGGFGPDAVDGFAFVATEPLWIDFALLAGSAFPADLDLCLYDPWSGQYVDCWQGYGPSEFGGFSVPAAGQEFHLVVVAASGAASYQLNLSVQGLGGYALAESNPTARGFDRGERPALRHGEALERYRAASAAAAEPVPLPEPDFELWTLSADGQLERRPGWRLGQRLAIGAPRPTPPRDPVHSD